MSNGVGNWRNHTLVKCGKCKKLMGFHVPSTIQICVECKIGVQK